MFRRMSIPDVVWIEPPLFRDARGWFRETYSFGRLEGWDAPEFVQDNESLSLSVGTVRGLHFQRAPYAQAKLVRCTSGAIFDVAVDVRPGSPTFGRHVSARLDADGGGQMLIPAGFAHGFCTLAANSIVQYKVSAAYAPESEGGIAWDDPTLGIDWPITAEQAIISERDSQLPRLADAAL